MACEKKYFPSSSLTSFAETSGKIAVNTACKKCGKTYVDLPYRRNHVGHHLNMKIQCPIRGCKSSGTVHTITRHLWSKHKKSLSKLTKQERNRFEKARRKFYEEVDTVMEEYFPEQRTDEVEPFCKKCGKNRPSVRDRRDHVGEHINVKFPCPFRNCAFSGCVKQMFAHFRYKHKKNLSDLTREQQSRYEESRRKFHEKVDAVMGRGFTLTVIIGARLSDSRPPTPFF
uniref:C2H2-type domain-containing protein n=1 Tax=Steinernema glaseri TaxID=37863 RepID=A0A1I7Z4K6_9BILA